jgi:hypothetical protein
MIDDVIRRACDWERIDDLEKANIKVNLDWPPDRFDDHMHEKDYRCL